jgi:hypothetical protein
VSGSPERSNPAILKQAPPRRTPPHRSPGTNRSLDHLLGFGGGGEGGPVHRHRRATAGAAPRSRSPTDAGEEACVRLDRATRAHKLPSRSTHVETPKPAARTLFRLRGGARVVVVPIAREVLEAPESRTRRIALSASAAALAGSDCHAELVAIHLRDRTDTLLIEEQRRMATGEQRRTPRNPEAQRRDGEARADRTARLAEANRDLEAFARRVRGPSGAPHRRRAACMTGARPTVSPPPCA